MSPISHNSEIFLLDEDTASFWLGAMKGTQLSEIVILLDLLEADFRSKTRIDPCLMQQQADLANEFQR